MPVSIAIATGSASEHRTRDQLERILRTYDLGPWQFCSQVLIEDGVIPHSHPQVTLGTRHLNDDALLLSVYVHEQLHWLVDEHPAARAAILAELRHRYPDPPLEPPRGLKDEYRTYLHYIVCHLEYQSLIKLIGSGEARRVMDFWCGDHYTDIYRAVIADFAELAELFQRHGLSLHPPEQASWRHAR